MIDDITSLNSNKIIYSGIKDFEMKVTKSDNFYNIAIIGKAIIISSEDQEYYYDYSMIYKGEIGVLKLK